MPHTSERAVRSSAAPGGRSGRRTRGARSAAAARSSPRRGCDRSRSYVTLESVRYASCFSSLLLILVRRARRCAARGAATRPTRAPKPRRHFVAISFDWHVHAAAALRRSSARRPARPPTWTSAQVETYEYRTRDEATLIDVARVPQAAAGRRALTVYPFGHERRRDARASAAASNRCRRSGSTFDRTGAVRRLRADRRAARYDVGAGIVHRRSLARLGPRAATRSSSAASARSRATGATAAATLRRGRRSDVGPFGVDLAVKFAWNRFTSRSSTAS